MESVRCNTQPSFQRLVGRIGKPWAEPGGEECGNSVDALDAELAVAFMKTGLDGQACFKSFACMYIGA